MLKASHYHKSQLYCEKIPLADLAAKFSTPTYVYSFHALTAAYARYEEAFHGMPVQISYAVKANDNLGILSLFARRGAGADVVSQGECYKALQAGISPDKIVFSGVGKTRDELNFALDKKIGLLALESAEEARALMDLADQRQIPVSVTVRFNPDVDPQTHKYIATGLKESKFGLPRTEALKLYHQLKTSRYVRPVGVSMHIGSQLVNSDAMLQAVDHALALMDELATQGIPLKLLDIGGGVGIRYQPDAVLFDLPAFALALKQKVHNRDLTWVLEPGRSLVGEAGLLLTRVVYVKKHSGQTFIIVDAGMNDLLRPTLYQAYHHIVPLHQDQVQSELVNVVGPVCESGDYLALNRSLPRVSEGDLLCVQDVGAYGSVMASNYNVRPRPAEVLVRDDEVGVLRERETLEDLTRRDQVPHVLTR